MKIAFTHLFVFVLPFRQILFLCVFPQVVDQSVMKMLTFQSKFFLGLIPNYHIIIH